jgi:hypothetical protein
MDIKVFILVKTGKDADTEWTGCILQSDLFVRVSEEPVADFKPPDKGKNA